ncbi:hypothetical protein ACFZAS_37700, partial [Streptomyces lavendulae]
LLERRSGIPRVILKGRNSAGLEHRLFTSPDTEPGAIPITVMRHPAAQATAAAIPSPDHGSVPANWAY